MKAFIAKHKKRLIFALVIGISLALYVPIKQAFIRYTDKVVRQILTDLVEKQTDGMYIVEYDNLRFNIFSQKLRLYDFHLYPKDTNNLRLDTNAINNKFYYGISIPEFEMELRQEWAIFFSNELSVKQATFRNPVVKVLNQRVQKTNFEMGKISGDLYSAVTKHLSAFQLSNVDFVDAKMDYYLNTQEFFRVLRFNEFSVRIRDLDISEERKNDREKILFADDFELTSKHQSFFLEDSSHAISFDKFHLSIRKKLLLFNNLRISPIESDSNARVNHLTLFAPEIKLTEVDFELFYQKNELNISKLFVDRPVAKLDLFQEKRSSEEASDSTKLKLFNLLKKTRVHQFMFNSGNLSVNLLGKKKTKNYTVKGISFRLQDFYMDSNIIVQKRFFDARRNFRLSLDEITHEIPEEGLLLKVGRTEYSSLTKVLDCSSIKIIPNEKVKVEQLKEKGKKWYVEELRIDKLHATKLDLEKVEKYNSFKVKQLDLTEPYVKLGYDTSYRISTDPTPPVNFNVLFSEFVDTTFIGLFRVLRGSVKIVNTRDESVTYGESDDINLWISNVSSVEWNQSELGITSLLLKTSVKLGKTKLTIPGTRTALKWQNFEYSKTRGSLLANDLFLNLFGKKQDIKLSLPKVAAMGVNPREFIQSKELRLKTLTLLNPKINVNSKTKETNQKSLPLKLFSVDSISIIKGDVFLARANDSPQTLEDLNLQATKLLVDTNNKTGDFKSLLANFKSGRFLVDSGRHLLVMRDFFFNSKEEELTFDEITFEPVIDRQRIGNRTVVKNQFREGKFSGLKMNAGGKKQLQFTSGSINEAETYMSVIHKESSEGLGGKIKVLHHEILKKTGWEMVRFDTFKINKGAMSISWQKSAKSPKTTIYTPKYSLFMEGFFVDANTQMSDDRIFYTKNTKITGSNLHQMFPDSENSLKAKSYEVNSGAGNAKLKDVTLSYMVKTKEGVNKMFIEGSIKEIGVKGAKPIQLLNSKTLSVNKVYLNTPDLDITQFHKNVEVVSRELELANDKSDDSSAIAEVLVKEFELKRGDVKWDFGDTLKKPLRFKRVYINGTNIRTNKDQAYPEFQRMELSFGDFRHEVLKGFYELKFDQFRYNSVKAEAEIKNMRLEPTYGIFEFAREAGWEKTRLELFAENVKLMDWDLLKSINNREMRARELRVDSLWTRSFKNKQLPMIDRYMAMPQELIRSIPFVVQLDLAVIRRGSVQHNQMSKNGVRPGRITFTELNASLTNLTNDSLVLKKKGTMSVNATTKLMGQGKISATFDFNLNSEVSSFSGKAHLDRFDPTLLNEFTEPVSFVRIKKGIISKGDVSFEANKYYGLGDARVLYKNLHIDFLNKTDPEKQGMGIIMKNFLANRVVNTNNPHFFITKEGDVFSRRDTTRAIFNYWVKLGMSGVVSSMGIRDKQIKKLKKEQLKKENAIRREEEDGLLLETAPIED